MSVKHVKEYYKQICDDYKSMVSTISELEELVSEKVISPERFEELKKPIETVKANWQRWSYVIFLLDQPNNKKKIKTYEKQHKALTNNFISKSEREENKEALEEFKKNIKEEK